MEVPRTQECHICLEDLKTNLAACPCGHVYHELCILQALEVNRQCPICRRVVSDRDVVSLYLDIPTHSPGDVVTDATNNNGSSYSVDASKERKWAERVHDLTERIQWQKKQYELLLGEMKRMKHHSETLVIERQSLCQRVNKLETNKTDLVGKIAKYQAQLSRQTEVTRQTSINQSIINYLSNCNAEVLEEELQNPRELIIALKKACKYRHDQYQKVVKDKMRLKLLLQKAQNTSSEANSNPATTNFIMGKAKLKQGSFSETKRMCSDQQVSFPNSSTLRESKKRKMQQSEPRFIQDDVTIGGSQNAFSNFKSPVQSFTTSRPTFSRSIYNPNQCGSYNFTTNNDSSLASFNGIVSRRRYDETGKLTNFVFPRDSTNHQLQVTANRKNTTSLASQKYIPGALRTSSAQHERREFGTVSLSNWLRRENV
jgi:hypothetical protein